MSYAARTIAATIVLCIALDWSSAQAVPIITVDYEGGFAGAIIKGGGWAPGEKVKIQLAGFPNSDLGTVIANAAGNINSAILPKDNLIDAGDVLVGTGPASGMSAAVIAGDTAPALPPSTAAGTAFPF